MSAKDLFLDRSLPASIEAERSVLGAILLDNRLCNQAMELLRTDDFYLDAHRRVYEKMVVLSEMGRAIDPITLGEEKGTVNFWSMEREAFPEEAVTLLKEAAAAMTKK